MRKRTPDPQGAEPRSKGWWLEGSSLREDRPKEVSGESGKRASDSTSEPDTGRRVTRERARVLSKATQGRAKTQMLAPTSKIPPTSSQMPWPRLQTQLPLPCNLSFWLWEVRKQHRVPSSIGQDPTVPANRE